MANRWLVVLACSWCAATLGASEALRGQICPGGSGCREHGNRGSADTVVQFHCNTGYTRRACVDQLSRLEQLLRRFDVKRLRDWTWILVRSQDWRGILRGVGRDPDSPAFTILDKRQIFLEEALFNPTPERSRMFLERWRIPLDRFLEHAVTHELGHALCRETREWRVEEYARELRESATLNCAHVKNVAGRSHARAHRT